MFSLAHKNKHLIYYLKSASNFSVYCNAKNPNLKVGATNILTRFKFNQTAACWKCGVTKHKYNQIFCEKCNIIQHPQDKLNYFKVMDFDEDYNIDLKSLQKKYRYLQSLLHPDKFSNSSQEEKTISEEYSSLVNKAYNNLQIPIKRAVHLLQLRGGEISDNLNLDDAAFLMEMMEFNEEVENASDEVTLRQLDVKNKLEIDRISREIDECFKRDDVEAAKSCIIKMKYFVSLANRINGVLREKGIVD